MPETVRFFQICLCCPGDVVNEKDVIYSLRDSWNRDHGRSSGCRIDVVHWSTDAFPELGDRPQEIVNRQIIDQSDILIGIFWTRFGSPTGVANSGTEEEIRRFIQQDKPAMVYFSEAPAPPSRIDFSQYERVTSFRKELTSIGLCFTYCSVEEFTELLRRNLAARMAALLKRIPQPLLAEVQSNLQQLAIAIQYLEKASPISDRFLIPRRPDETDAAFRQREIGDFNRSVSFYFDPAFLKTGVHDALCHANAQAITGLPENLAAVIYEAYSNIQESYSHVAYYKKLIGELELPHFTMSDRKEQSNRLITMCLLKMRRDWMQAFRCWLYLKPRSVDVEVIRSEFLPIVSGELPEPADLLGDSGWKYAGKQAAAFQKRIAKITEGEHVELQNQLEDRRLAAELPATTVGDAFTRAAVAYCEGNLDLVRRLLLETLQFNDVNDRFQPYVEASLKFLDEPELFHRTLGVYLSSIDLHGRGNTSGLREKDIVVSYRGTTVRDPFHLATLTAESRGVENVPVEVVRNNRRSSVLVTGGYSFGAIGTNLIIFQEASV